LQYVSIKDKGKIRSGEHPTFIRLYILSSHNSLSAVLRNWPKLDDARISVVTDGMALFSFYCVALLKDC